MAGEHGGPGLRPRRLTEEPAAAAGAGTTTTFGTRFAALASAVWAAVRPTRSRSTGYIAIGAVGALIGTSVAVGVGASGAVPALADIGAWLGSTQKGTAAHVNGLTGDVDGRVDLPTGKHPVSISQDGKTVLVLDRKTGDVVRIDPSQLTAEQRTRYSSSTLQLVAGGSFAYLVDPAKHTVQRIDPVRTTPIGARIALGSDDVIGKAVVDPEGTLWVPDISRGEVLPFPNGHRGKAIRVAKRDHDLVLTLANGRPVVTDTTGATLTSLDLTGPKISINLPRSVAGASQDRVLVPDDVDGDVVPVLAADSGQLTLVDVGTGDQTTARLGSGGGADYGPPQVLGSRVYVPNKGNGTLKVYDTAQARLDPPIDVTGKPGDLQTFVRNGLLWVNDQNNASAAVVNANGGVHHIGKYKVNVPTARKPRQNVPPAQDNVPDQPVPPAGPPQQGPVAHVPAPGPGHRNPPGRAPGRAKKPVDPCVQDPSKCGVAAPVPSAPGTPQAQSGPNGVTVNFSPASGSLKPTGYTLNGAAGGSVNPATVRADGPFTFQVTGLDCARQYSFTVVAHYQGGTAKASGASPAVRPCTTPSQPQNLRISYPQGGHGFTAAWAKPANASGTITYTVTWPGGSTSTTGTSATASGLRNGQSYTVTVTARNAAGSSAPLSGTANLTPPAKGMSIADNVSDGQDVGLHSQPNSSSGRVGAVPPGWNGPITVYCQTTGSAETHDTYGWHSSIWDKITYNGTTGWISDLWVSTANHKSGQFSPQDVWQCT
jgi:hypothetical protein